MTYGALGSFPVKIVARKRKAIRAMENQIAPAKTVAKKFALASLTRVLVEGFMLMDSRYRAGSPVDLRIPPTRGGK